MASTKLTRQEMGQIIDTLPKKGRDKLKSTYQNIFDDGVKIGLPIGIKQGKALAKLNLALQGIEMGLEIPFVVKYFALPKRLVERIQKSVKDNFKTQAFSILLADEILQTFPTLSAKNIVQFTKLPLEIVEKLKEEQIETED